MRIEPADALPAIEEATALAVRELTEQEKIIGGLVETGWRTSALMLLSHGLRTTQRLQRERIALRRANK